MRLSLEFNRAEFTKAQLIAEQKLAKAATGAMRATADLAKEKARASIDRGATGERRDCLTPHEIKPSAVMRTCGTKDYAFAFAVDIHREVFKMVDQFLQVLRLDL